MYCLNAFYYHASYDPGVSISSELQDESFEKCILSIYFLNKDISSNIPCTLMKSYMPVLEYVIEGTVSQIFDLGPSFYFMKYRK